MAAGQMIRAGLGSSCEGHRCPAMPLIERKIGPSGAVREEIQDPAAPKGVLESCRIYDIAEAMS